MFTPTHHAERAAKDYMGAEHYAVLCVSTENLDSHDSLAAAELTARDGDCGPHLVLALSAPVTAPDYGKQLPSRLLAGYDIANDMFIDITRLFDNLTEGEDRNDAD